MSGMYVKHQTVSMSHWTTCCNVTTFWILRNVLVNITAKCPSKNTTYHMPYTCTIHTHILIHSNCFTVSRMKCHGRQRQSVHCALLLQPASWDGLPMLVWMALPGVLCTDSHVASYLTFINLMCPPPAAAASL